MRTKIYVLIGLCYILILHKGLCQNEDVTCDPPWKKVWHGCYLFLKDTFRTWSDARANCTAQGGDLFVINDAKEMEKVGQKLRMNIINVNLLEWWVGLQYSNDSQVWKWIDQSTLDTNIIAWDDKEPDVKQCGAYNYQDNLKDEPCSALKPYVCEFIDTTTTVTTSPDATTAVQTTSLSSTETPSPTVQTTVSTVQTPKDTTPSQTSATPDKTTSKTNSGTSDETTSEITSGTSEETTSKPTSTISPTGVTATASPSTSGVTETSPETNVTPAQTTEQTMNETTSETTKVSVTNETTHEQTTKTGQGTTQAVTEGTTYEQTTKTGQGTTQTATEATSEEPESETTKTSPPSGPTTAQNVTKTTSDSTTQFPDEYGSCHPLNSVFNTDNDTCPPLNVSGISWPRTEAGMVARVSCGQGPGEFAKWKCQSQPVVCWKEDPDVSKCPKPTTPESTQPTTPEFTTRPTLTSTPRDLSDFDGCYSVNYDDKCPPVTVLGVFFPETGRGQMRKVNCPQGQGKTAKWKCQSQPVVCWKGEPDVSKCTSEMIQNLTNQADVIAKSENNSAATIEFMDNLADSVSDESTESDLFQSTKLMSTAKKAKPANEQAAKDIVKNALKCGNNIISSTKKLDKIDSDTQVMIASSLLSEVEGITMTMMESINTTGVSRIEQPNMEVELQVVDIDEGGDSVKYEGKSNTNTFTIPTETLREYTTDRPVKVAFIQYNSINKLLESTNRGQDNKVEKLVISDVVSASIGRSDNQSFATRLTQPIRFNFETGMRGGKEDFNKLCSFWNFSLSHTGDWSQKGCELGSYNATQTTCKCYHLTNFAILMDVHSTEIPSAHKMSLIYITYVGCIISIICLFLSLVTFMCLSSVQGERNSIHKNLVFCLFVAEVLFLAGVERTENKLACSIIAGFLHFFFLSSFSWMFVEGIHILFMLVQVFDSAKSRLKYYYAIGYGCPVIIVGISAAVYHEGYGTESYCWLTAERQFIWSFAGPVAFILLVNLIVLIYAMTSVCKHSEYVFTKDKSRTGNMRGWIQGALALEVLLGLTWVFGYFYISEEALPVTYLFTIFNSLQGVFIFVFHCLMNKKVRKEYQRFIDYKPTSRTSWTTSKSANGTPGHGTGSSGLPMTSRKASDSSRKNSDFSGVSPDRRKKSDANGVHSNGRKNSGFTDIALERHGSSSA